MFLIVASLASIMTVIGGIRVVAQRWICQVIFSMLTTLFFFVCFFFLALDSNDNVSDKIDDGGSVSGFTSGSYVLLCFELSVDRVS